MEENVENFINVCKVDRTFAESFLEAHDWNLENAIASYMETNSLDDQDLRAPIPVRRQELLSEEPVGPSRSGLQPRAPRAVFEMFRDFKKEEVSRKQQEQSVLKYAERQAKKTQEPSNARKLRTLADLFKPPVALIYPGSFDKAKSEAAKQKKWLLVNIQDVKEFDSQRLNRDTWSNQQVQQLVSSHFLLWQVYCDSDDGLKFVSFYKVQQCPYIAILDPRTGESVDAFEGFLSGEELIAHLNTFLRKNSLEKVEAHPDDKTMADLPEEEQLAAAIAASMAEFDTIKTDAKRKRCNEPKPKPQPLTNVKKRKIQHTEEDLQPSECTASLDEKLIEEQKKDCTLQIRLTDGSVLRGDFPSTLSLRELILWIKLRRTDGDCPFVLVTPFPRRSFENLDLSLKDADLTPRAVLIVQEAT